MKYSAFFIVLISCTLFFNCSKKDLPAPDPLNANNTKLGQQTTPTQTLTAPCEADLTNNTISYTYSPEGSSMSFSPQANDFDNQLSIICTAYSSYNQIKVYLPSKGNFIGKLRYEIKNTNYTTATTAILSHIYNNYFYTTKSYIGYEGVIYAEYTPTQIKLSFCEVKVKDTDDNTHTVTGKIIVPNNNN